MKMRFRLYEDEIVCLFTDIDIIDSLSLYCTVIYWLRMCINHSTWWLPVGATPHTGVEPCVRPKTIVVGFPRIVIIRLLALAKTGRRFTALEWVHVHQVAKAEPCKGGNAKVRIFFYVGFSWLHDDHTVLAGIEFLWGELDQWIQSDFLRYCNVLIICGVWPFWRSTSLFGRSTSLF
jgi:hypothetical protein